MSEDKDALIAQLQERIVVLEEQVTGNTAPAVEEGPHLRDPEIARLKREQIATAGGEGPMTDDMKRLMRGGR